MKTKTSQDEELWLEFMSKKELAPIDRVNFMKDRIEEATEEAISKTKASMAYNPNNTEGINKKICRRCGYTRKDTLKEVFAEIERGYCVLWDGENKLYIPAVKKVWIDGIKKHFGVD
jgi:hypothetical protein